MYSGSPRPTVASEVRGEGAGEGNGEWGMAKQTKSTKVPCSSIFVEEVWPEVDVEEEEGTAGEEEATLEGQQREEEEKAEVAGVVDTLEELNCSHNFQTAKGESI